VQWLFQVPNSADGEHHYERSLRLQYLAGLSVDHYEIQEIYRAMARYRRYPEGILIAPAAIERQLKARWSL